LHTSHEQQAEEQGSRRARRLTEEFDAADSRHVETTHLARIGASSSTDDSIEIAAPFVEWSKTDIVERRLASDAPCEHTWSCYWDETPACGTCDACAFRLQTFQRAEVADPVEYDERPSHVD
jgi:preQ(0) biosynthesis protein QueC